MASPTWSTIRGFGNSKVLRSSYVWLLVVPVIVKLLSRASSVAHVTIAGQPVTLDLSLPFSWELFFYAALFTAIGNTLYSFACPWLVKRFTTYATFKEEGRGPNQVREEFTNLLARPDYVSENNLPNVVREYYDAYGLRGAADNDGVGARVATIETRAQAVDASERIDLDPTKVPEAFWYVRDYYDQVRPRWRFAVMASYTIGLLLFGVVLVQNVLYVVEYSLGRFGTGG